MPVPVRKASRFARARASRGLNRALARADGSRAGPDTEPLRHPPLFVVGAPRSGSTLLYQLLVVRFDVAYLSNLHCALYGSPALVERVAGRRLSPPPVYSSRYGRVAGLAGPSECGPYWYRFFRKRPQHVPLEAADPEALRRLRASVRALGDASRRPIVFKNLLNAVRLGPLAEALPEALFLVITRDREANAASIVGARRAVHGDETRWWSVEPPGFEGLRDLPPGEQAAAQVDAVLEGIAAARRDLGADRFLEVAYERLCADTHAVLGAIASFASARGVELGVRRPVPERFPAHGGRGLEAA